MNIEELLLYEVVDLVFFFSVKGDSINLMEDSDMKNKWI